jgi:cysteine desulfurase / selenocysteine lyase
MSAPKSQYSYENLFIGTHEIAPLLDGSKTQYINFDNAASTPSLRIVQDSINSFLPFYSSVHRGTGFKSQLSTYAYEKARETILEFVGANPAEHICIFGKNTTESINKLAHRFPFTEKRNIVLTSGMEHHSNDLPWRSVTNTIHIALTKDGRLDEEDLDKKLKEFGNQIALLTITGASNVTGFINPYHRLAEKVHAVGGKILVDCAQLAPHRKVDMRSLDDPSHLDFVSISAHKMYAPFGTGALIGRKDIFAEGDPDYQGGGTVEIVTLNEVTWAEPPEKDEAGSPNTVGAIAMAIAAKELSRIGYDKIAAHETELTYHILEQLSTMRGVEVFGNHNADQASERLGVIPIKIEGISHFKVAAILGHEFGIGVRSGCFCAHPYILHLLHVSPSEANTVRANMLAGDRREMPGLIRVSFGLYNTTAEIDRFRSAIENIQSGNYFGNYHQAITSGEYIPEGWNPDFKDYFSF